MHDITITKDLIRSPFDIIFIESLDSANITTLAKKAEFLVNLSTGLNELEIDSESTSAKNHWLSIVGGFSSALTIAGSAALVPPFGMLLSGVSIAAAINTVYTSFSSNATISPIIETLKLYRLAIESQEAIQWSTLWAYTDNETFCKALKIASNGYLSNNGNLIHKNGDTPFTKAVEYVANCQGISLDAILVRLKTLKSTEHIVEQPSIVPLLAPQSLQYEVSLPESNPGVVIGAATRLGAVDIDSEEIEEKVTFSTKPNPHTALASLLAAPFESRAFFGAQRTGKTYLAAVASKQLSERGIKTFHINLASYVDESGDEDATYWRHAVKSVRCDLSKLNEIDAERFVADAIDTVYQFFATPNAILIFDEITITGSVNNQYVEMLDALLRVTADKIACLASTGTKRFQSIWTVSPDFVAGSLSSQTKAIKSLKVVFVAIPPNKFIDWKGQRIGFHLESFVNVQRNFTALTYPPANTGYDRVCFVDGKWREIGELPSITDTPKEVSTHAKEDSTHAKEDSTAITEFTNKLTEQFLRILQDNPKIDMNVKSVLTHPCAKALGIDDKQAALILIKVLDNVRIASVN